METSPRPGVPEDPELHLLRLLARLHGVVTAPQALRHTADADAGTGDSAARLVHAARALGLAAHLTMMRWHQLASCALPALARLKGEGFVLLMAVRADQVLVRRAHTTQPERLAGSVFRSVWTGELLLVTPREGGFGARSGARWLWAHLARCRSALAEIMVVSLCLNLLGLVAPVVFQAVIDKVLVHRGESTLDVLCAGLLLVTVFETLGGLLRSRLVACAGARLERGMGEDFFEHLLRVPLAYFEARRIGDILSRVRELEHLRSFLAGVVPVVLLDLMFVVVFCALLLVWSPALSLVVILGFPCLLLLVLLPAPLLRARLESRLDSSANLHACVVETTTQIRTVKANALEVEQSRRWCDLLARAIGEGLRSTLLASTLGQLVAGLQKVQAALILWFGAREVMQGGLTVGELVAFNLVAARAGQPLLRLAQAWQEFLQVRVATRRVSDLLAVPPEPGSPSSLDGETPLTGQISFENVSFAYVQGAPEVLHEVSFAVRAGEVLVVVGGSGSGKSTLTRLLQRLYVPTRGRISLDGRDLAQFEPATLRRQLGVVDQDCRLFNRSIRDNIAARDPGVAFEQILAAAQLADAHDFIRALPAGYDTVVSEQGVSLSGGQIQRLALARALLGNPRILVLDEVTSALDAASERRLIERLPLLARDRTLVLVTHRPTLVSMADRVLVMAHGRLVQQGPPALLARLPGPYRQLWPRTGAG